MAQLSRSSLWIRIADRLDQAILIALFFWLCLRLLPDGFPPQHPSTMVLLISEAVVLFFVLTRRSTDKITLNLKDWTVALAGTTAVMLVENTGETLFPKFGAYLIFFGFSIHFGAKLSLRRSFGIVPADRGIISSGLYAIVRHPMYLGYMISHIGFLISMPSAWNFAVYAIAWPLLIYRIILEERLLLENTEYQAYSTKVCYRFIPGIF
ncbi:Isoprenylcysteine carboxyl methyltransferase (ICMT) family protein [compost metagenome]